MAQDGKRRDRKRLNLLDAAQRELVRLINDRCAEVASGTFGVLIVLDRGQHRHLKLYLEQTIAAPTAENN